LLGEFFNSVGPTSELSEVILAGKNVAETLASPAMEHSDTRTRFPTIYFQVTLKQHKVWQRLRVVISTNILQSCDSI